VVKRCRELQTCLVGAEVRQRLLSRYRGGSEQVQRCRGCCAEVVQIRCSRAWYTEVHYLAVQQVCRGRAGGYAGEQACR